MFTNILYNKRSLATLALIGLFLLPMMAALFSSDGRAAAQSPMIPNTSIVESEHPYANDEDTYWVINNNSGQNAARVYFSRIELENTVDKIEIRDQNDTLIQEITTSAPNGMWSDVVPGSLIKIVLKSDSSGRFWGFAVEQIEYLNYTTIAYSPHPYPNNYNDIRTFLNPAPNPAGTRLHFDRIELEQDVDYLIIMDADDNPYQWITGNHPSGFTSKAVPGAVIKLHHVSDGSGQRWGYNIDAIQTASPGAPDPPPIFPVALAESDHPYLPATDETWVIVNPNVNAVSSKVHFSQIELEEGDIVRVMDQNDVVIQTFAHTSLSNVWSDYVPGRVVKIRLTSNSGPWTYTDWGFRVDAIVDSVALPGLAQSHHPYGFAMDEIWTIINPNPNAVSSKIHFSRMDLAEGDIIRILDQYDVVIQTFWGNTHLTDTWSDYVPGRTVKIRMTSNSGSWTYVDWGFRADAIVDSVEKPGLAQSNHPYEFAMDQVWTLVNPNINATSSKIHFNRIDLSEGDTVRVMDQNDTVIQTFGVNTHLTDVWSDYVPGRIVKVRLTSNSGSWTYVDWGFRVDDIYPASEEPIPRAYVSGIYLTVLYPGTVYLNGVEVAYAQEPGDYRIMLPGVGNYTIHIVYQEYTQDIVVVVGAEGGVHITYLPLVTRP